MALLLLLAAATGCCCCDPPRRSRVGLPAVGAITMSSSPPPSVATSLSTPVGHSSARHDREGKLPLSSAPRVDPRASRGSIVRRGGSGARRSKPPARSAGAGAAALGDLAAASAAFRALRSATVKLDRNREMILSTAFCVRLPRAFGVSTAEGAAPASVDTIPTLRSLPALHGRLPLMSIKDALKSCHEHGLGDMCLPRKSRASLWKFGRAC